MNKRIAIINPFYSSHNISPRLGIGYLSSFLKKNGWNALLIDALKEGFSNEDAAKILNEKDIKIAAISCGSAHYEETRELSVLLKKNGIKVIIGGVHPTFYPYLTLKESNADFVVCGEGEKALLELLNNNFDNTGIKGVYSLSDLKDETTPFEKTDMIENLDDIPFPDWEQMQPGSFPAAPHGVFFKKFPIAPIITSRMSKRLYLLLKP